MDWKVQLEADDETMTKLREACTVPNARITRNGVEWFIESSDFEPITDHFQVKQMATSIVNSILTSGNLSGVSVGMGAVFRMHYDGSKTAFRDG